jgi:S-DNA-T family DNA segregation ATPase FtsK/SpoIIIE
VEETPVVYSPPVVEAQVPLQPTLPSVMDAEAASGDLPGMAKRDRKLPPLNLLMKETAERPDQAMIHRNARLLESTLAEFGVPARVTGYRVGPTVTQFAVEPGYVEKTGPEGEVTRAKVRVSQISALARDLAMALSAERLRIEAPVPGQSFVGIEVPNSRSSIVRLRPILESEPFQRLKSPLAIALGQDVSGQPVVADLSRMPHTLIAGTTGSGKSVCIAALTTCLVVNNTPEDLRLIMLDPKMVELVRFNGLPHILGKVETQLERMLAALKWVLMEMDHRYRLLEDAHARDLQTYNRKMERRGQPTLPRMVLLVDELADLMMSAPEQTEHSLVRLAQMARATGIHLVVATQRPSTDVVTGLIKANFPARISFTVASSIDSRVILDTNGAETLLGHGDMLFLNPEEGTPTRAQGVFVNDEEVGRVVAFWSKLHPGANAGADAPWEDLVEANGDENSDALVKQATQIVRQSRRASASMLQRRLRIGYPRAARLMDELEDLGVVGPVQAGGREREVLIDPDEEDEMGEREEDDE